MAINSKRRLDAMIDDALGPVNRMENLIDAIEDGPTKTQLEEERSAAAVSLRDAQREIETIRAAAEKLCDTI